MKHDELFLMFELLLLASVILFIAGWHNIDNAWNTNYIRQETGQDWRDSSLFLTYDPGQQYMLGSFMMLMGFVLLAYSTASLSLIYSNRRNEK